MPQARSFPGRPAYRTNDTGALPPEPPTLILLLADFANLSGISTSGRTVALEELPRPAPELLTYAPLGSAGNVTSCTDPIVLAPASTGQSSQVGPAAGSHCGLRGGILTST